MGIVGILQWVFHWLCFVFKQSAKQWVTLLSSGISWYVTCDSCSPGTDKSWEAVRPCVWTEETTCSADWKSSLLRGLPVWDYSPAQLNATNGWVKGVGPFDPWWEIPGPVISRLGLSDLMVLFGDFIVTLLCLCYKSMYIKHIGNRYRLDYWTTLGNITLYTM